MFGGSGGQSKDGSITGCGACQSRLTAVTARAITANPATKVQTRGLVQLFASHEHVREQILPPSCLLSCLSWTGVSVVAQHVIFISFPPYFYFLGD